MILLLFRGNNSRSPFGRRFLRDCAGGAWLMARSALVLAATGLVVRLLVRALCWGWHLGGLGGWRR